MLKKRLVVRTVLLVSMAFLLNLPQTIHAIPYTLDFYLPLLSSDFYREVLPEGDALTDTYDGFEPPLGVLMPGQAMRINILVPPGVIAISIGATSNNWIARGPGKQPIFNVFGWQPNVCLKEEECDYNSFDIDPDEELNPAAGGLSLILWRREKDAKAAGNYNSEEAKHQFYQGQEVDINEPIPASVVFYNPPGSTSFEFGSVSITIVVENGNLYNAWRDQRSWAGGSGNETGVGEELEVDVIPPPPPPPCSMGADDLPCFSSSTSTLHIPKVIVDGIPFCGANLELLPTGGLLFNLPEVPSPCSN
jgi:hypothetical protein